MVDTLNRVVQILADGIGSRGYHYHASSVRRGHISNRDESDCSATTLRTLVVGEIQRSEVNPNRD